MDKQDEGFFQKLTKHREGLAKALEDPALRGVQSSVVDKYRDQAHFIYELMRMMHLRQMPGLYLKRTNLFLRIMDRVIFQFQIQIKKRKIPGRML